MVRICSTLVDTKGINEAIRIGDVFSQLIEYHYNTKDYKGALVFLQKMQAKKILTQPYLDPEIVENIYKANGMEPPSAAADVDDGIGEEIDEDI